MALRMRPSPGAVTATLKGAQDWLTEADGAVERFLSDRLAVAFPADGFQGEEGGKARQGTLRWVVDPIDGTSNYARGSARFCVSLALLEDRTPLIGVLVAPAIGETFAARLGGGATLNGATIRAAATTALSRAIVEVGGRIAAPLQRSLRWCSGLSTPAPDRECPGPARLAGGRRCSAVATRYVELHIRLLDVAAAIVLLGEAGGLCQPVPGRRGPERGNPILVLRARDCEPR